MYVCIYIYIYIYIYIISHHYYFIHCAPVGPAGRRASEDNGGPGGPYDLPRPARPPGASGESAASSLVFRAGVCKKTSPAA